MRNADNDDDELPFQTLAAATAKVVSKMNKEQDENRDQDRGTTDQQKQDGDQHRQYVDQRLHDLAAFERRAKGIGIKPRRGPA